MDIIKRRYYASARLLALVIGSAVLVGVEASPEPEKSKVRLVAVITHLENEVDAVPRSELARMFLKQQTEWPNGERCIPIDQRGENPIRKVFSQVVLRRSLYDIKRYWMQETMTGNARPPVALESASTVKKYVQKLKGAVAYIYLDELDDTVRILGVTDVEELAQPSGDRPGAKGSEAAHTPDDEGVASSPEARP